MTLDAPYALLGQHPGQLAETEIQDFIAMVRAGGEVGGHVLEQNVRSSELLLTIRKEQRLIAVAALKKPAAAYRRKIAIKAGVLIDKRDFPFELGYMFVLPSARGQGLATSLCEAALAHADSVGVFATTRAANEPMAKILRSVGFEPRGEPYASGRGQYQLQLFARAPAPT